ncbi:MAG: hypothetical protein ACKPKO_46445, partial [Candidatus Fonsibacter sp.]
FVSLWKGYEAEDRDNNRGSKIWNDFFSPMSGSTNNATTAQNADGEFEFHMQIGSKLYPEYPIRSHAEAYYQLRKTLGLHYAPYHGTDITG